MLWLASRQLVARRLATLLVLFGLSVSAVGYVVIVSVEQATSAQLSGDIAEAWKSPFDLLVRPAGSRSAPEVQQGLVRPNYISSLVGGGISLQELARIRSLPGIAIAAPLAVVGTTNWQIRGLSVADLAPVDDLTVYAVRLRSSSDAAASSYEIETHYVVVSQHGRVVTNPETLAATLELDGHLVRCAYPVTCRAPEECFGARCEQSPGAATYGIEMLQPIVIAGVDPAAEAAMTGVDRCLSSGRYLRSSDQVTAANGSDPPGTRIPVLVSDRSFIDETLVASVSSTSASITRLEGEARPETLQGWRHGPETKTSVDQLYRSYLGRVGNEVDDWPIWTASDVRYTWAEHGMTAVTQSPSPQIYERPNFQIAGFPLDLLIPPSARDSWFRSVASHPFTRERGNRYWQPVGTYDPLCVPGFGALGASTGMDAYSNPVAQLAGGQVLRPNRSAGGYLATPPLVLTTLAGAAWFSDPSRFVGGSGELFISVIRVKVAGTDIPGSKSLAALTRAAIRIHDETGLEVDVVKGSSRQGIQIYLPPGAISRPAMSITEEWSKKGVAVTFSRAVSGQSLGLLGLVSTVSMLVLAQTAYIATRRRQLEFNMLRALGWRTRHLIWLVCLEAAILGGVIGLVAAVVGTALAVRNHTQIALVFPVLPLVLLVSWSAALPAVVRVGRSAVGSSLIRQAKVRPSRVPRSLLGVGLRELTGAWRVEASLGVCAVALGTILVGEVALSSLVLKAHLDITSLGSDLDAKALPFHWFLAVLSLLLAGGAAAEISVLSYLERRRQHAVLRAQGWRNTHLMFMIAAQAVLVASTGTAIGLLAVVATGVLIGSPAKELLEAAGTALLGGAFAGVCATVVPTALLASGGRSIQLNEQ